MSAAQGGGVRVVIVTTQYIETDPANFKSVVQNLTAKNSNHHHIQTHHNAPPKRRKLSPAPSVVSQGVAAGGGGGGSSGYNVNLSSLPSSSSLLSDLDRLHTLPSWEEISHLCM